jgi:hypothetical protein
MSSNDGAVIKHWVLAGLGVMVRSEWDVAEDLAAGTLVHLLPDWSLPAVDIVEADDALRAASPRRHAPAGLAEAGRAGGVAGEESGEIVPDAPAGPALEMADEQRERETQGEVDHSG